MTPLFPFFWSLEKFHGVESLTSKDGGKPDFVARPRARIVLADKFSPLTRDFRAYSSDLSRIRVYHGISAEREKGTGTRTPKETLQRDASIPRELETPERMTYSDNCLNYTLEISIKRNSLAK